MKKEIYKGVEYHYPERFETVEDYLASITAPVIDEETKEQFKWDAIRDKRNIEIKQTDWTQMSDSPLTVEQVEAFKAYRQTLRDIPQNFDDPDAVVWPEKPTL